VDTIEFLSVDTIEFLRRLSDESLDSLPYMVKAEKERRRDAKHAERMLNHQCETLEEIRKCPICCIP
jgi:hypothetical protein